MLYAIAGSPLIQMKMQLTRMILDPNYIKMNTQNLRQDDRR